MRVIFLNNHGMDKEKTRRTNLNALIEDRFNGKQASFVEATGANQGEISTLISGKRTFGERKARKLEKLANLPDGWLDRKNIGIPIQAVDDDNPPADAVQIRRVKFNVSAGISGSVMDQEEVMGNPIFFRRDWLAGKGYFAEKLVAVDVHGESMEPGLYDGDTVIVNTGDVTPRDGCVFVLRYEDETVVKRMLRDAGKWWLCSDNADQIRHPRKEAIEGLCEIIGRVIHKQSDRI